MVPPRGRPCGTLVAASWQPRRAKTKRMDTAAPTTKLKQNQKKSSRNKSGRNARGLWAGLFQASPFVKKGTPAEAMVLLFKIRREEKEPPEITFTQRTSRLKRGRGIPRRTWGGTWGDLWGSLGGTLWEAVQGPMESLGHQLLQRGALRKSCPLFDEFPHMGSLGDPGVPCAGSCRPKLAPEDRSEATRAARPEGRQQKGAHKGPHPPPPLPQDVLRRPRRFLTDPFSGPWTQWWPLDMIQHKGRSEGGGGRRVENERKALY